LPRFSFAAAGRYQRSIFFFPVNALFLALLFSPVVAFISALGSGQYQDSRLIGRDIEFSTVRFHRLIGYSRACSYWALPKPP